MAGVLARIRGRRNVILHLGNIVLCTLVVGLFAILPHISPAYGFTLPPATLRSVGVPAQHGARRAGGIRPLGFEGGPEMRSPWEHTPSRKNRGGAVGLVASNDVPALEQKATAIGVQVLRSGADSKWKLANTIVKQRHPLLKILLIKWPGEWLRGERQLVSLGNKVLQNRTKYPEGVEPSRLSEVAHIDIGSRYRISGRAGRGAFASVLAAKDLKTGELVAIKRVGDAAPDDFAVRRLLRELYQLRKLRGHANVVSVSNLLVRTRSAFDHALNAQRTVTDAYLVTDLMMTDLSKMMDHADVFTDEQVRCLMFQFFRCLRHMHRCGIVHRDIKPPNLLVDSLWHLKMCDLGIARQVIDFNIEAPISSYDRRFTDYVVTRPYRAPELLMGSKNYTTAIDMWAAGCIMAELLASQQPIDRAPLSRNTTAGVLRMPLFPGFDHRDMMQRIVTVLGHPPPEVLSKLSLWEPRAKAFVEKQPFRACDLETQAELSGIDNVPPFCTIDGSLDDQGVDWEMVFPYASPDALHLLRGLLNYDPQARFSAEECLRMPYFTSAVDPDSVATEQDFDFALRRAAVRSGGKESHDQWEKFWKRCERRLWRKT